jgi:hypothetical protein
VKEMESTSDSRDKHRMKDITTKLKEKNGKKNSEAAEDFGGNLAERRQINYWREKKSSFLV